MALVRCPTHKIPYNDATPRGCPACAQEKGDGGTAHVMKELARVSQSPKRITGAELPPESRSSGAEGPAARASRESRPAPPEFGVPVTQQPRIPEPEVRRLTGLGEVIRGQRFVTVGSLTVVALALFLFATSGPKFAEEPSPPAMVGPARPLAIAPDDPVGVAFSLLGPIDAEANPTTRALARYDYGSDLVVDAMNGLVYALTFMVANRSWQGLQVGIERRQAEGALALLGPVQELETALDARADTVAGYVVYRSLDARPRRMYAAEVRPPNGCYDVTVDVQPRAIGTLATGGRKLAVVARAGGPIEWVVTRVCAVSRSMEGPYAGDAVC